MYTERSFACIWQSTTFAGQTGSARIRQDQTASGKRQLGLFPFEIINQNNQLIPVLVNWFLVTLDRMKREDTNFRQKPSNASVDF